MSDLPDCVYNIDNSIIKHNKYLGVTIDEGLNASLILLTKLGRLMPIYVETFTSVHLNYAKCNLYKSMVLPIIE